ncbi:MAG: SpoIIE family protein phosphatase [Desulfobacterales bacterium]|nr:MAG: SpoIIE family protein phosphatase [Desulfobacterales bacterium]
MNNISTSIIQTESLFEVVLNTVTDGVTVVDNDLKIKFENKTVTQFYGSRVGEHCYKAYRSRTEPCEGCLILEVLEDGKDRRWVIDLTLPNGDTLLLEVSSAAIKDEKGNITGAVEVSRDVTEQKKAEAILNKTLLDRNEALKQLSDELSDATGYVKTVLPQPITSGPLLTDWRFIPSVSLGGDSFGYHWIDEDHFAMYLLDVSGHGWSAALLSVSVINVLRSHALPDTDFRDPQQVLFALNNTFPGELHNDMFFTIWYGAYNLSSRQMAYASGGHPPALLFYSSSNERSKMSQLRTPNFVIGGRPDTAYQGETQLISRPSRLYIFSDGVFDITKIDGSIWGLNEFLEFMTKTFNAEHSILDRILGYAQEISQKEELDDDFTILEIFFE